MIVPLNYDEVMKEIRTKELFCVDDEDQPGRLPYFLDSLEGKQERALKLHERRSKEWLQLS